MKHLFLIIFWAAMLWSCREVSFTEPQPAGIAPLKEVPPKLRGYFQTIDQNSGEFSDTLIIESWGYHLKDKNDVDWLGHGVLNDSLVLKFYQNYYFVNFKSGDQWALRLIKQNPNGSIEFLSIDLGDDISRKEILKKLSKKVKVTEVKRQDDIYYQIRPTPAQLMSLIQEGFFTGTRINKTRKL